MQLTLKYKFMIPTLLLLLLCMGVATIFSFSKSYGSLEKAYTDQTVCLAETTAHKMEAWIKDQQRGLSTWAGLDASRRALDGGQEDRQAIRSTYDHILKNYPEYDLLALLDRKGKVVVATDALGAWATDLAGQRYFREALAGKLTMSEAIAHPTSGLPVVAVLAPVTKSGRTAGVLLGLLEVESFSKDFIAHLSTGETGYVYMTNGDGLVLAHPKAKNLMKLDLSKYDFGKQMITKRDGVVRYVWEGVDKIVGFHEVDDLGWIIAATANCDELFAPAMEVRNSNIIVGAVALLAGAILLWAVTLWVVRPIIRIITSLKEGSSSVAAAAGQISSSSQILAEGATEQAASLEETSAALETLTSMTTRNAEDAANAENIAHTAKESMEAAARDMGELTGAIADISEASQQTDKIIKSIDEIAFQTNLLALNAAVEAARAGQAGAGFAVVADEVRSLAMRAADAAHDTSQRIEATMVKARQAEEVVSRTNDSFNEVSHNSSEILELVLKIAQASQEQADGLGQLSTAARQMDHTTQTNAVHSEESAAASEELFSQAAGIDKDLGMLAAIIGGGGQRQARAIGSGNGNGSGAQRLPDNLQKALPAPDAL